MCLTCSAFPALSGREDFAQRASARFIWSEGLVRLGMRWGTEPEGWCVDHPYAVFRAGVNYSPLELQLIYRRGRARINLSENKMPG